MERIILARHGETDGNVRSIVNGDPSIGYRLTPAGREQARELGRRLAELAIDLCVVTEFGRTVETADLALAGRRPVAGVLAEGRGPDRQPFPQRRGHLGGLLQRPSVLHGDDDRGRHRQAQRDEAGQTGRLAAHATLGQVRGRIVQGDDHAADRSWIHRSRPATARRSPDAGTVLASA